jgi:putative ABC transport system permease protein
VGGFFKIIDVVLLGLRSLLVHKVRSFLTALGILFGVWSVIAMLAISGGLSSEAQKSLRALGSDNIIIDSEKPPTTNTNAGRVATYGLTRGDVEGLKGMDGVVNCAISHRLKQYAYANGVQQSVNVIATEPTYSQLASIELVPGGRFLSAADQLQAKAYCVITDQLARKLFKYDDPHGRTVKIGEEPFMVIGVLRRLPEALARGQSDAGNCVLIPLSTDRVRFGEINVFFEQGTMSFEKVEVSQVILQMRDEKAVVDGAAVARRRLAQFHKDVLDYRITVPVELMEQKARQRQIWNIMFVTIACISLLVGGIGIMNIMLASVTERTREIGIRRAMGAKRADITVQFLVESVTLTFLGGLLGIVVGAVAIPLAVEHFLSIEVRPTALMLLLPFVVAVGVGLAAGLYPAYRAAKLDPIVALRHE